MFLSYILFYRSRSIRNISKMSLDAALTKKINVSYCCTMSNSNVCLQFRNCKVLRNHNFVDEDLWVRNGLVVDPELLFFNEKARPDRIIDLQGKTVVPGLIDIQINGGFGFDFAHDYSSREGLNTVASGILAHGVTSFCPTLVTSKPGVYKQVIPKIQKYKGGKHGAEILGIHAEGPFISKNKKGAHSVMDIADFEKGTKSLLEVYGSLDNVCIVTLAPEKENALEVIKYLKDRGILVSLGHSDANYEDGLRGMESGACLITHLFNAMLPFHHRDPGLVGLLTAQNGLHIYYSLIADGIHTHPSALRIAYKTHPKGLILVTDAISALGLLEGIHHIGELTIEIKNNQALIAGTNTLCGSISPLIDCVKIFLKATGCSPVEALEAASLHPAKALGISHKKGTLNFGVDADFIVLDDDLNVLSTWISGECVFKKS